MVPVPNGFSMRGFSCFSRRSSSCSSALISVRIFSTTFMLADVISLRAASSFGSPMPLARKTRGSARQHIPWQRILRFAANDSNTIVSVVSPVGTFRPRIGQRIMMFGKEITLRFAGRLTIRQRELTTTRSAMPQQKDPNREERRSGSLARRGSSGAAAR
jgi:hypothetical protein